MAARGGGRDFLSCRWDGKDGLRPSTVSFGCLASPSSLSYILTHERVRFNTYVQQRPGHEHVAGGSEEGGVSLPECSSLPGQDLQSPWMMCCLCCMRALKSPKVWHYTMLSHYFQCFSPTSFQFIEEIRFVLKGFTFLSTSIEKYWETD